MDLATFRRTSQPIKSAATYRPLTDAETADYLRGGTALGNICTAGYLRMTVLGAEDVAEGLYLVQR